MKAWLGIGLALGLLGVTTAQTGWIPRTTPVAPSTRGFHELAYDMARGVTVLFGGWDSNYLGDTWEWDGVAWTQRTTTTAPSPRLAHAMAYDIARNRVVLFGGAVGTGVGADNDETWEWDGVTWTQLQPTNRPPPRRGANMTYDPSRGVCVLFGGGITAYGAPVLDDTWEWNGSTWTQHLPSVRPPARWNCFLAADWSAGHVVMSGGGVGSGGAMMNDTWTWNGILWQPLAPTTQPTARRYGGAAFDIQRGVVVAWSGMVQPAVAGGSTWVWDGSNWRHDARPIAPPARWATAAAFDVGRGRMVVFGGFNGSTLQDTWEYEAGPLATCVTSGPGCPGASGVPSLTTQAGALPVLGTTWTLRLGYGASNGVAALAIGLSDQLWGSAALPFDLAAVGMPGCTLRTSTDWLGALTLVGGSASVPWTLPATPSLAGVNAFAQALVLEPGTNALGAVLSNSLAASTGPY